MSSTESSTSYPSPGTPMPADEASTNLPMFTRFTVSSIVIVVILFVLLGVFTLMLRMANNRYAGSRYRKPWWKPSIMPTIPAIVAFPVGLLAALIAAMPSWQLEAIARLHSPNAVLRLAQAFSFTLRLCATLLAWAVVGDIGWLFLAHGARAPVTVTLLDIASTGAGYGSVISGLWANLKRMSFLHISTLGILLLIAGAADLVGVSIVASTGVSTNVPGLTKTARNIPFTSAIRLTNGSQTYDVPDQIDQIYSSAAYYPHILRQNDTYAFLPVQIGDEIPSSYKGVAYFGKFSSQCESVEFTGKISLDPHGVQINGTLGDIPYDEQPLTQRIDFHLTSRAINVPIGLVTGTNSVTSFMLPCNKSEGGIEYKDPGVPVYLYFAFKLSNFSGEYTFPNSYYNTEATDEASGHMKSNKDAAEMDWSIQVCRIEVPYKIGEVEASFIDAKAYPIYRRCADSSELACPKNLTYHYSHLETTAWDESTTLQKLNVSRMDISMPWTALKPLYVEKDQTGSLGVEDGLRGGVIFCRKCQHERRAGTVLSISVSEASDEDFAEAFGTGILHAIAATYRSRLPYLEGVGNASYTLRRSVVMITTPIWLYAAVIYTCLLAVVSIWVRCWMLWVVGADRTGSLLAGAALVKEGPLTALLSGGSMLEGGDFVKEAKRKLGDEKVRLWEGATGRYGLREAEESRTWPN